METNPQQENGASESRSLNVQGAARAFSVTIWVCLASCGLPLDSSSFKISVSSLGRGYYSVLRLRRLYMMLQTVNNC